jgi:acetylornithine deacetylase
LESLELALSHSDFQSFAPALSTVLNDPLVSAALSACKQELGQDITPAGVPYCSDASWVPDGIPAIVLGPGDIAQAHAVDEYVELDQVVKCAAIYRRLLLRDWSEQ